MKSDLVTAAERRTARTITHTETRLPLRRSGERAASLLAGLLPVVLVGLALAWLATALLPALGGLLVATVLGFGALRVLPVAVVRAVVAGIEFAE
ncbi:hypothetical protein BRC90_06460 [Halobacteriales archaeon QS_4_69_34]|nr:MAG: hypothetical protein BRC90_06460 [Halobacteriales archaeon QS_4_69_34]